MSTSKAAYHHGDLRAALLDAAVESLEADEPFSMRAVARRAGVSQTAPYRHFVDRRALDSAVAARGFDALRRELEAALAEALAPGAENLAGSDPAASAATGSEDPAASDPAEVLAALAVAYVSFALRRPQLFRLMFGDACDEADSERVRASGQLHALLSEVAERLFPGEAAPGLPTAMWSLAHGLAFLHLDGKYRPEPESDVADRVRGAVAAILAARPAK